MIIEITAQPDYLYVRAEGEFSLAEAKQGAQEMLQAVIQYEARKVLFDGRALSGKITEIERFQYAAFVADVVVNSTGPQLTRPARFAYVLMPPFLDPQRFGETVAMNRGMNVKTFDNLANAFAWLDLSVDSNLPEDQPE